MANDDTLPAVRTRRRSLHSILGGVILLTLPCYCIGVLALAMAPSDDRRPAASITPDETSLARVSLTPAASATTALPTLTATPTLTPTLTATPFVPPSRTPSLTPTTGPSPTPSATATSTPTATPTATATPAPAASLVPFSVQVNFQPEGSEVPAGYLADVGQLYGDRGNGHVYGWDQTNEHASDRDSNRSPDQRYDTFNRMQDEGDFTWEIAVPNGTYEIFLVAGDPARATGYYAIEVEGVLAVDTDPSGSDRWAENTVTVTVADGRLTVTSGPGAINNKICFIEISRTG